MFCMSERGYVNISWESRFRKFQSSASHDLLPSNVGDRVRVSGHACLFRSL